MLRSIVLECSSAVLILIVMEERIGFPESMLDKTVQNCLNPYCNGRKNRITMKHSFMKGHYFRLNPYCNGRKNRIFVEARHLAKDIFRVLILIVMEERIGQAEAYQLDFLSTLVLILIVMEERIGLREPSCQDGFCGPS